jgi:hypothetical protein
LAFHLLAARVGAPIHMLGVGSHEKTISTYSDSGVD